MRVRVSKPNRTGAFREKGSERKVTDSTAIARVELGWVSKVTVDVCGCVGKIAEPALLEDGSTMGRKSNGLKQMSNVLVIHDVRFDSRLNIYASPSEVRILRIWGCEGCRTQATCGCDSCFQPSL